MNTTKDISDARSPELRGSLPALRRAAEQARRIAIQTGTKLVIVQDGKTVRVPADAPAAHVPNTP